MKYYFPKNSNGEKIGFKTLESSVYDKQGIPLSDKLKDINTRVDELSDNLDIDVESLKKTIETTANLTNVEKRIDNVKQSIDNIQVTITDAGRVIETIDDNNAKMTKLDSDITALKKSVSDGKKLVADAITGKGIETATNATFETIKSNIDKLSCGVYVGEKESSSAKVELNMTVFTENDILNTEERMQYRYTNATSTGGGLVYLDDYIYAFKMDNTSEGASFATYINMVPFSLYRKEMYMPKQHSSKSVDACVTYKNKIYVSDDKHMSVYNEQTNAWDKSVDIPITPGVSTGSVSLVVFKDKIHLNTTNSGVQYHYAFDGTTWKSDVECPIKIDTQNCIIASTDNGIHAINNDKHYMFDGKNWIEKSLGNFSVYNRGMCAGFGIGNNLYVITALKSNDTTEKSILMKYNEETDTWTTIGTFNYRFSDLNVVYSKEKEQFYIVASGGYGNYQYAAIFDACIGRKIYTLKNVTE